MLDTGSCTIACSLVPVTSDPDHVGLLSAGVQRDLSHGDLPVVRVAGNQCLCEDVATFGHVENRDLLGDSLIVFLHFFDVLKDAVKVAVVKDFLFV